MNKLLLLGTVALCGTTCASPSGENSAKNIYSGLYVGGGVSYQHTRGDVLLNDNYQRGNRLYSVCDANLKKTRLGKVGGSLILGYGDFLEDLFYCSAEFTLDITGNKTSSQDNRNIRRGLAEVKTQGVVPTFALRLGGYVPFIDALVYARAGISVISNKFKSDMFGWKEVKSQSVVPVIGLGFEKKIYDNFTLRIEGDYRLSTSKKKSEMTVYDRGGNSLPGYHSSVNNKVSGYAVRAVCVYHF